MVMSAVCSESSRRGEALRVCGLTGGYPGRTLWSDVSFDVVPGSITAILGNNGTGKSTMLSAVCGIFRPAAGRIFLGDTDLGTLDRRERARRVALVPQRFVTTGASVYDTVLLGRFPHFYAGPSENDHVVVERILTELGLTDRASRSASTLSGGEAQKVMLARALVQDTDVLLLDEPTSNLDLKNSLETLSFVKADAFTNQRAVLMVNHDVNTALSVCTHFVLIDPTGRVTVTNREELTEEYLSRTYGVPVRLRSIEGRTVALAGN